MISRFQPAADDLSKTGHIRIDAIQLGRSAKGGAESADDLVKDEANPLLGTQGAQPLQKSRAGRDYPHIAGNGFYNDRRYLPPVFLHRLLDGGKIIIPAD